MTNLVKLDPPKPEVHEDLLRDAEEILARVRSGEIQSIACTFVKADGGCETYFNSGENNRLILLAGAWLLLSRLTDNIKG